MLSESVRITQYSHTMIKLTFSLLLFQFSLAWDNWKIDLWEQHYKWDVKAVKDRNPLASGFCCGCFLSRAKISSQQKKTLLAWTVKGCPQRWECGWLILGRGKYRWERKAAQSYHSYEALSPKCALATQHGFPAHDLLQEFPLPWTIQAFQIRHHFCLL